MRKTENRKSWVGFPEGEVMAKEKEKAWPNWVKVLSLQLQRDSALTDQSGKRNTSKAHG